MCGGRVQWGRHARAACGVRACCVVPCSFRTLHTSHGSPSLSPCMLQPSFSGGKARRTPSSSSAQHSPSAAVAATPPPRATAAAAYHNPMLGCQPAPPPPPPPPPQQQYAQAQMYYVQTPTGYALTAAPGLASGSPPPPPPPPPPGVPYGMAAGVQQAYSGQQQYAMYGTPTNGTGVYGAQQPLPAPPAQSQFVPLPPKSVSELEADGIRCVRVCVSLAWEGPAGDAAGRWTHRYVPMRLAA